MNTKRGYIKYRVVNGNHLDEEADIEWVCSFMKYSDEKREELKRIFDCPKDKILLDKIYVNAAERRKGAATKLMKNFIVNNDNKDIILNAFSLDEKVSNEVLKTFYKSFGFEEMFETICGTFYIKKRKIKINLSNKEVLLYNLNEE